MVGNVGLTALAYFSYGDRHRGGGAGEWRRERPWQNRGGGGSGGAKDVRKEEGLMPAFLKAWTSKQEKQMAGGVNGSRVCRIDELRALQPVE